MSFKCRNVPWLLSRHLLLVQMWRYHNENDEIVSLHQSQLFLLQTKVWGHWTVSDTHPSPQTWSPWILLESVSWHEDCIFFKVGLRRLTEAPVRGTLQASCVNKNSQENIPAWPICWATSPSRIDHNLDKRTIETSLQRFRRTGSSDDWSFEGHAWWIESWPKPYNLLHCCRLTTIKFH